MATSGSYDESMTAIEIVGAAMRRATLLRQNQKPDLAAFEAGRAALTRMLKVWTLEGANLWRDEEQTVTLVSGRARYTLKDRPMRVRNVRLCQSGAELRPLGMDWSRDEYDMLPMKTSAGDPVNALVVRDRAQTDLILWPVPNRTTLSLKVGVERVIEDVTAADEEIDAPQEWFDAAIDNLGVRLADEEGIDPRANASLRMSAAEGLTRVHGFDRTGPVRFEADFSR